MEELFRTNNPVLLSVAAARLDEAGIKYLIADQFMSSIEGSIGAIPRRFLVEADGEGRARVLLKDVLEDIG